MSKKLKRSAVALVLAATMVFSSQGVLTAFAAGGDIETGAPVSSALERSLDKVETDVADESGNTDETETPEVEVCEECQGVNGNHAETCPHYVDPNTPPENPTDDENNNNQEQQECTCGAEEGQPHEEGCPLYEEATIPECTCGAEEGQPHEEGCPLYEEPTVPECTCGAEEGQPHQEGCPLYEENTEETQEPSEEDVAAAKNVSDLIGALPEASTLDPETTDVEVLTAQVKAAREAYDKLTDAQKALVEKAVLDKLVALEGALEALQNTNVAAEGDVAQIGDHFYSTLSSAISAANSGDTIYILKDFTLDSRITYKDKEITIAAADNSTFTIEDNSRCGISISGDSKLTFKNLTFATNGQIYLYNNANLTFQNSTLNMDGEMYQFHSVGYYCIAIALENRGTSLSFNDSTVDIANYPSSGSAIRWDDSIGGEGYAVSIVNTEFTSSNCYSGFVGTCNILIDNSRVHVKHRGNGSNGSNFDVKNYSNVVFEGNGSHGISATSLNISDHSVVTSTNNKMYGIYVSNGFSVDGTSTLNVTQNSSGGDFAGLKLTSGVTDGRVESGATVNITDNYCSGLSNNGKCVFEDGVKLTITGNKNSQGGENGSHGGGIYNSGASAELTLPSDAVIYNNHALTDGDDIYNTGTITFGKVGSDWKLDGAPDCNHAITGWFDDSKGSRWEAHDAPLHVSEFTDFNDAGIATISGLTALKAAHPYLTPEIEPGDPDVPSSDWPISKSKTAENLDENFESKVTLSLPADSYKPSVDVVMVMDVSSSMKGKDITEAKAAATAMCDELASKTNANVNIGIVTFDKKAHNLTNGLVSIEEAKNAINNIVASDDTNMMAGLIAGKAMLDAGTATDKYLVIMSDGIPIYWVENGETISKTLIRYKQDKVTEIDRLPAGSEPEGSAPEDFDSMLSIKQLLNITDWDTDSNEWKQVSDTGENINPDCKYTNIQKATYKTAQYMIDNIFGQYKIKMVAFGTDKYENNVVYKYGENLCDWIGDQDGVSYYKVSKPNYGGEAGDLVEAFTDIANEMIYLVDAGSQVVDEIGFGTYEDGTEYDFDFVNEISKLELTVGGKALDKVQIDDYTYGFGPDSTLPKDYQFIVTYYPNGLTRSVAGELFVWDIYVPITIDDKVQLTYSVKLNDPRTDDGEYGIYDPDGSENRNGLYTNNAAVLYPVDSNGNNGEPEAFDKPTVSYTVSNGKPVEPTPDPDPDPDRPSRPNRDDDDDWEPLPDAPVKDKPTTEVDVPEETETPTTEQPDKYNPETGDTTTVFAAMALAAVSLGGVVLLGRKKK